MQPLEQKGYSYEQVRDILHARTKSRNVRFRYDLLDKDLKFKRTLTNVLDGEVAFSAFSAIKRTAKFTLKEDYIDEHIERKNRKVNYNIGPKGTTSDTRFDSWSKTNFSMDNGEMMLQPFSGTLTNSTMENGWRTVTVPPDPASGWMTGSFKPWNSGPTYKVNKGRGWQGEWAQEFTRTTAGDYAIGMQTISSSAVIASGGQKVYASFFYSTYNGEPDPNYIYAIASSSSADNFAINQNVVKTYTGVGQWYLWEGEGTVPAGKPNIGYGLLVASTSNVTNGICNYDNLYFGTNKAIYSGVATSPILDMSDTLHHGIDIPRVKSTEVRYSTVRGTPTNEGSYAAPEKLETRYSLNGGTTWSSWVATVDYGNLGIPSGSDAQQLRVQLRWNAGRHNSSDAVRFKDIDVYVTYEEDTYIPKKDVINYLSDRIKPYMEVEMESGVWVEFPLGVFLLNSPTRVDQVKGVYRDIEAYDQLVVLQEDKLLWNRTFWGYPPEIVTDLLVSMGFKRSMISIPPGTKYGTWNFSMGTPVIEVVNKLLDSCGYTPLWTDANGVFRSSPYILPSDRSTDYTYQDDDLSVIYNGIDEELDLFNTANYFIVIQSNVEQAPLWASKANNDPTSPLSTVSTGRRIVDYREVDNLPTQADVEAYVDRLYQETTMAYEKIKFKTALMPIHEYQDCLRVIYSELEINDRYIETAWRMPLRVGGTMEHEARKVVST